MERKHYFTLRSLVTKYGKDNVINLGIIAWIGLSIYQKIRQIQGKKKDKKEIKSKEDKE
ncbi:hypothetical protein [Spiroplasma endosymbiont of Poecilobothrus nobilitatus]|uniref:hypothetical protein n=1 Tax=Spiroplasma endosymbiont of Poecilobothrus nobilitatus TaxID=1209220 RepID=UPI00313BFE0D